MGSQRVTWGKQTVIALLVTVSSSVVPVLSVCVTDVGAGALCSCGFLQSMERLVYELMC